MLDRRAWGWVLLPFLFVSAGCIPPRDNPHDPSRVPDAVVRVVDRTEPGGTCGALDETWPQVWASSRRTCLALSALGSEDPQNGSLRYRFSVLTDDGPRYIDSADFAPEAVVAIPDTVLIDLPFDEPSRFQVEAKDREGAVGRAEGVFVKTNTRPVAAPGTVRSIPIGGHPWAPGEPAQVRFDGRGAYDPDGDPLQWCWRVDGAAETCGSDREIEASIPTDRRGAFTVSLRVLDGNLFSSTTRFVVLVQEPAIWHSGKQVIEPSFSWVEDDEGSHERLATAPPDDFLVFPGIESAARTADGGIGVFTIDTGGGVRLVAVPLPEAGPATTLLPPSGIESPVVVPIAGSSDFFLAGTQGTEWVAQRYSATRTGQTVSLAESGAPMTAPIADEEGSSGSFAGTDDGSLWILPDLTDAGMLRVTPGASESFAFPAGTRGAAVAARPVRNEAWALVLDDSNQRPAILHVQRGASGYDIELPTGFASAFAWVDENEFWIDVDGFGLCLVDAGLLEGGVAFELAVMAVLEDPGVLEQAVADPSSGDLWAWTNDQAPTGSVLLVRARTSGVLTANPVAATSYPRGVLFTGPDGRLWAQGLLGADVWVVSEVPSEDAVQASVFLPPVILFDEVAFPDPASGGLWAARSTGVASSFVLLDQLGKVSKRVSALAEPDGTAVLLDPILARAAPDGENLFVRTLDVSGPRTMRVSLAGSSGTAVATEVLEGLDVFGLLEPSAPGTDPELVWAWTLDGFVRAVPLDGSTPAAFAFDDPPAAALSPLTSSLCVASHVPGTTQFELQLLRPNGMAVALGTATVLENTFDSMPRATAAGATTADGKEVCWFGLADRYREEYEIRAVRSDGVILHRLPVVSDQGVLASVAPFSDHQAWATVAENTPGMGDWRAHRVLVEFDPAVGSTAATMTAYPQGVDGLVIGPFGGR